MWVEELRPRGSVAAVDAALCCDNAAEIVWVGGWMLVLVLESLLNGGQSPMLSVVLGGDGGVDDAAARMES